MISTITKFDSIDNILGLKEQRFFGKGFQKVTHKINDIEIGNNEGKGYVRAKASVLYPVDWSKKSDNTELRPHLSTIDAFVLSVQLSESYLVHKFGLNEQQRRKMWIHRVVLKAGSEPQEQLNEFVIHTRYIGTKVTTSKILGGNISTFESQIGAIKVCCEIAHELGKENNNNTFFKAIDEILGDSTNRYYGDGYKLPEQNIRSIAIDIKNLSVNSLIEIEHPDNEILVQEGIEADYRPTFSIIDCMITIAQIAQALLYKLDNIDRSNSNTLWMRKVIIESDSPYQPLSQFTASTKILESKLLKIKGKSWRTSDMSGECSGIKVRYSIAHELPNIHTEV